MTDELDQAKCRLRRELNRDRPFAKPLDTDRWMANSLLQKSIRRGEVEVAQRAALTFFAKGSAIWRRFIIIAFEDIGAGSADVAMAESAKMAVIAGQVETTGEGRLRILFAHSDRIGTMFAYSQGTIVFQQIEAGVSFIGGLHPVRTGRSSWPEPDLTGLSVRAAHGCGLTKYGRRGPTPCLTLDSIKNRARMWQIAVNCKSLELAFARDY